VTRGAHPKFRSGPSVTWHVVPIRRSDLGGPNIDTWQKTEGQIWAIHKLTRGVHGWPDLSHPKLTRGGNRRSDLGRPKVDNWCPFKARIWAVQKLTSGALPKLGSGHPKIGTWWKTEGQIWAIHKVTHGGNCKARSRPSKSDIVPMAPPVQSVGPTLLVMLVQLDPTEHPCYRTPSIVGYKVQYLVLITDLSHSLRS